MYYTRQVSLSIKQLIKGFPVISVIGPRQSGKTTFIKKNFPNYTYFNLEDPQTLQIIEDDPVQFFKINSRNIIIDEVQRLPQLLSYIQVHVDQHQHMGSIILSGSQNLLISQSVSQSLAGRAAYQTILPFSQTELVNNKLAKSDHFSQILTGFYPAVYTRKIKPNLYYRQYITTYVERDARLIKNIQNLSTFKKFIGLVAGRVGQLVNSSSLANDVGVAPNTIEDWLSILEASFIIYRLQPYFKNFGKRLIKSPKIYFYDTGLLCSLLNISTIDELKHHYAVGNIFENLIISEFIKNINHTSLSISPYFYRDSHGNEIDLILDTGSTVIPIEIKSSSTYHSSFLVNLDYWQKHIDSKTIGYLIYSGNHNQIINHNKLTSWNNIQNILYQII